MIYRIIISLLISTLALSILTTCNIKPGLVEPIDEIGVVKNTNPISSSVKPLIEGIYKVVDGRVEFGEYAVVKLTRNHLSIFCEKNSSYFILNSGEKDSTFYFEGFWRFSQAKIFGKVSLLIDKQEGGTSLFSNSSNNKLIIIKGSFSKETDALNSSFRLEYLKPLTESSDFYVIAHRGGGRNSDRLQASENSLEILKLAEYFGANSVEIDIQLTKDNIPILFHDEEFTPRLVKGNYLIGSVSRFSFKQIRTFGKLINDEMIPTLEEALDLILNKTTLKLVWLDVKYPNAISIVAPIQKKYSELANSLNRDLTILIGLPSDEVLNEYLNYPGRENYLSLCELDINSVRKADSKVWAPRWTDGIPKQQITSIQAENRKVFIWTLDIPEFIKKFIDTNYYNGILTNYPSVVAYEYYMKSN